MTIATSSSFSPLTVSRIRVVQSDISSSPDLSNPEVVEALLADARKVAREEREKRSRRSFWRR